MITEYYPVGKIFEERICWLDESEQHKKSGLVWDYSDIAIKFKNWYPDNGSKFKNENEAFSFFFQEVYNKDFR